MSSLSFFRKIQKLKTKSPKIISRKVFSRILFEAFAFMVYCISAKRMCLVLCFSCIRNSPESSPKLLLLCLIFAPQNVCALFFLSHVYILASLRVLAFPHIFLLHLSHCWCVVFIFFSLFFSFNIHGNSSS